MIKNTALLLALSIVGVACSDRADDASALQGVVELDERRLGFDVGGRIAELAVREGAVLEAGTRIAALDDAMARAAHDQRAAEVRAAQAQLDLLRAGTRSEDVRAQAAVVEAARAAASRVDQNLARERALAARGAGTAAVVADLEAESRRARAETQAAEQRLRGLRGGARGEELAAAEARLAGATAALAAETERLARHVLVADGPAVVLDVHLEPGEIAAAGAPVVTVADTHRPYVDVFVPQERLGGIRVGAPATVRIDALAQALGGTVEEIGRRTEFTPRYLFSPRERPNLVVRVRIRVDDPTGAVPAGVPAFVEVGS
jgi:HlyD family secretion protein